MALHFEVMSLGTSHAKVVTPNTTRAGVHEPCATRRGKDCEPALLRGGLAVG